MSAALFAGEALSEIYDVAGRKLAFVESGSGTNNGVGGFRDYSDVINIDGTWIKARVTIVELSSATITTFDSTSNPYGNGEFLQPTLNIGSAGGYATLRVDFFDESGQPATLQNFYVNTYDLDGAGAATNGRQFTDFTGFASYALSTGTKIDTESISGGTRFITTVGGNLTYSPDTNDFNTIRARVYYTSASSITIKIGDAKAGGTAYFGLDFSVGYAFNNVSVDTTAPVIATGQSFSYVENQSANAQVAQVAATDAIGVTAFRFTNESSTSADGYYTIDNAGAVRITAAGVAASVPNNDFDILPNSFLYGVYALDAAGNRSNDVDITLNVTAAPPRITGPSGGIGAAASAVSVNENQTSVTTLSADRFVTWSITGGADASKFEINTSTGAVIFKQAPDFENPTDADTNNIYVLVVTATDTGGRRSTQTVSVTVMDVLDNPPVITGPGGVAGAATSAISVNENQTAVTTLTANETVSWAITGGADSSHFRISSTGVLTFAVAPDFEAPTDADEANTYVVEITATSVNTLTAVQTITVTVKDLDEPPPVITGPSGAAGAAASAITVDENQTAVTDLTANRPVVWAITGGTDADKFAMNAVPDLQSSRSLTGVLTFVDAPDYENPTDTDLNNVYAVEVSATDANNETATQTVSVTVRDVDEPDPVITGPDGAGASSAVTVDENQTAVTTVTADKAVTWSISAGDDKSQFAISTSGVITFVTAPDYEAPTDADANNVYLLVVKATDANNETAVQTVSVTVRNLAEPAPVITGPAGAGATTSSVEVNENQTAVTTLTSNRTVRWSVSGGADAGHFNITASTGDVTFNTAPDFEAPTDADANNVYVVELTATDANNESSVHTLSVRVLNLQEPVPVLTGPSGGSGAAASAISVDENQTAVTTLTANRTVTFAITGGADADKFTIGASSGTIIFVSAPDYEAPTDADTNNVYVLVVTATDANNETVVQTVSVTVLNLAEPAPVLTGPGGAGAAASAVSVNENQTAVTSLSADRAVSWAITGGADAARFTVDAATGAITFVTAPDFEAPTDADLDNVNVVELTATDANKETASHTVTVTVLNLSEPAPVLTGPDGSAGATTSSVSVDENQTVVTDLMANRLVVWAITGGADAGQFIIDAASGAISFRAAPDYETPTDADRNNVYVVEVSATDANKETSVHTLSVTVLDVVDTAPTLTTPDGSPVEAVLPITILEDQEEVTILTANRPVNWAITGGADSALFRIDNSGAIRFISAPDYAAPTDADHDNCYIVEVSASDSFGFTALHTVLVTIENNDHAAPVITGPDGVSGAESSVVNLPEGTIEAGTFQANETVSWSLVGGSDAEQFSIDATSGALIFKTALSFEAPQDSDRKNDYVVVVRATDTVQNASDHTLTVNITDVDEVAPRIAAIATELRSDLRNYAFNSLGDMLSFNESLFRDTADCLTSAAEGKLTPGVHVSEFNQGTSLDWAKTHCTARYRIIANAGAAIDHSEGQWTRRGLGSVRVENDVSETLTLGVGLMGSFANNELPSFEDSAISDQSLQVNGYLKAHLSETLRAGAFVGFGRAWYDFELHQPGFDLTGTMVGRRQVYGAMLSGDVEMGQVLVTTDIIVSRATEDLGQATLVGTVDDDTSRVLFEVGGVDMTRISIPVSGEFTLWGAGSNGWQSTLRLSPGLLCEDTSAETSDLTCGYQFRGRLIAQKEGKGGAYIDYRIEAVDRRTRNMIGIGYQHVFGAARNLEWSVDLAGGITEDRPDSRAMFTFRARQ